MNLLFFFLWLMIVIVVEIEMEIVLLVLVGVFFSLVVIYFVSKLGGEVCFWFNLLLVLGELVGGVLVGVLVLKLLLFFEGGLAFEDFFVI